MKIREFFDFIIRLEIMLKREKKHDIKPAF